MDANSITLEKLSLQVVDEETEDDGEGVKDHETSLGPSQQPEDLSELNQSAILEGNTSIDNPSTPHSTLVEAMEGTNRNNSNVAMIVATPSRRVWSLGTRYIVKEWICPHHDGNIEANATKLLRERGVDVPVPDIVTSWKDGDWAFMISERLPGQPLMDVWPELSTEDRHRIAKQTADMVSKFRTLTSDTCCALDGGSIKDVNMLLASDGQGRRSEFGPLDSDAEVWEQMFRPRLDHLQASKAKAKAEARGGSDDGDAIVVEDEDENEEEDQHQHHRNLVRKYMPSSGPPYVFTHGDLAFSNILVEVDGDSNSENANVNVSGVLDFEFSAYLPVWWEHVAAHFSFCRGDEEWKELLRLYLELSEPEPHAARAREQAIDWYLYWAELCKTPLPEDIGVWAQILAKHGDRERSS